MSFCFLFLPNEEGHLPFGDVPSAVADQPALLLKNQVVQVGPPGRGPAGGGGQRSFVVTHADSSMDNLGYTYHYMRHMGQYVCRAAGS